MSYEDLTSQHHHVNLSRDERRQPLRYPCSHAGALGVAVHPVAIWRVRRPVHLHVPLLMQRRGGPVVAVVVVPCVVGLAGGKTPGAAVEDEVRGGRAAHMAGADAVAAATGAGGLMVEAAVGKVKVTDLEKGEI